VHGGWFSDDSIQSLLAKHVRAARETCPSLKSKRVSPHVLRHSAAMELLKAGVDGAVIALWRGHESVETTHSYLHAHLALKEAALAKLKYEGAKRTRFRPNDACLPSSRRSDHLNYAERIAGQHSGAPCQPGATTGSSPAPFGIVCCTA
jgi:integrase/recombinase XerD